MKKKALLYVVVKYVPDLVKDEPRNIGVIVQSRDVNYADCRFLHGLRKKLDNAIAAPLDLKVIRAYIKEFTRTLKPYSTPSPQEEVFNGRSGVLGERYLHGLAEREPGKIQFTEPRGCLTADPEKELRHLFRIFVGDEGSASETKPQLKNELRKELKERNLIAPKRPDGIQENKKVAGGKSKVEHEIDFSIHNGTWHLFEAVDLRASEETYRSKTYEAVAKFEDLRLGKSRARRYSIVAQPRRRSTNGNGARDESLRLLSVFSDKVWYYTSRDKAELIAKMERLLPSP